MKPHNLFALSILFALTSVAFADEAKATEKKDAWKIDTSITTSVTYDTNIYQAGLGPLARQDGMIFTVSPTLKASRKLYDFDLSFGYTPSVVLYSNSTDTTYGGNNKLSYFSQDFSAGQKFKKLGFNWELKEGLTWILGHGTMPVYRTDAGTGYTPGFTAPKVSAGADQLKWTESFKVDKKWDKYLLEFVGKGTYFDYNTEQKAVSGATNLTDRYDVFGGVNFGYKTYKDIYALLGYRGGYQWQGINPSKGQSYNNIYNRLGVGARGTLFDKKLTFDFLVGGAMHSFTQALPASSTFDKSQAFWWYEGSVTYKPTKNDAFTGTLTRAVVLNSTGGAAMEDIVSNLKYTRTITSEWSADAGVWINQRGYLQGIGSTTRHEVYYQPSIGVNYAHNKQLNARLSYTYDSLQSDVPASASLPDGQEFKGQQLTLSATYKF